MNRDQLEGSWRQVAGKMKERWGTMTGDPLVAAAGRREQLGGRVQKRRGISTEQSARQLSEFMYRNRNWYLLNR
jgi:uncharacterized protein YjbJ (UPF0337 family)